jgi:hypothetical protein
MYSVTAGQNSSSGQNYDILYLCLIDTVESSYSVNSSILFYKNVLTTKLAFFFIANRFEAKLSWSKKVCKKFV